MPAQEFEIGEFIFYQGMITKVEGKQGSLQYGSAIGWDNIIANSIWFTDSWYVNHDPTYYRPLHISDFQSISRGIALSYTSRDVEKIKKLLGEALIWYLARHGYEHRTVPSETNRVCEIPF